MKKESTLKQISLKIATLYIVLMSAYSAVWFTTESVEYASTTAGLVAIVAGVITVANVAFATAAMLAVTFVTVATMLAVNIVAVLVATTPTALDVLAVMPAVVLAVAFVAVAAEEAHKDRKSHRDRKYSGVPRGHYFVFFLTSTSVFGAGCYLGIITPAGIVAFLVAPALILCLPAHVSRYGRKHLATN
jgi:hypothetical protein